MHLKFLFTQFSTFFYLSEPPMISPFSFDSEIESGRDAQLVCYVPQGDAPLTITWYFHGRDVSHVMGVNTMKVGARSSILSITSATHGHSGVYTCVAANKAGEKRHSASLVVHGRSPMQQ